MFPYPPPSLNFSGCPFPAPTPPALVLAIIPPHPSSATSSPSAAAAAVQTRDNARVSFVADAGACSDALTSAQHDTASNIPAPASSNTQFCTYLISWSLHSHGHMSAAIELSPQHISTGIPFHIHVSVSGTPDSLSAASAVGFYGIRPLPSSATPFHYLSFPQLPHPSPSHHPHHRHSTAAPHSPPYHNPAIPVMRCLPHAVVGGLHPSSSPPRCSIHRPYHDSFCEEQCNRPRWKASFETAQITTRFTV